MSHCRWEGNRAPPFGKRLRLCRLRDSTSGPFVHQKACTKTSTAAQPVRDPRWPLIKGPAVVEWINKLWCIPTVGCHYSNQKKETTTTSGVAARFHTPDVARDAEPPKRIIYNLTYIKIKKQMKLICDDKSQPSRVQGKFLGCRECSASRAECW